MNEKKTNRTVKKNLFYGIVDYKKTSFKIDTKICEKIFSGVYSQMNL